MPLTRRLHATLFANANTIGVVIAFLLFVNTFVLVDGSAGSTDASVDRNGAVAAPSAPVEDVKRPEPLVGSDAQPTSTVDARTDVRDAPAGTYIPGKGTIPFGIKGNTLKVVYYWKGDQTKSSPFLAATGTGQEGNVDEGKAFTTLVRWINKHADGGELMGFKFNMHGWKLDPVVVEAGNGDDQIRAAERIASEIKPFAAVSSHGSISAYVCPYLARTGIINVSTYDLDWGLRRRTNGFCLPQGLSFDAQADLSVAYLKADSRAHPERRYGFLYATYPGLTRSAPKLVRMLEDAGVPIVATASVDPGLPTAGRQQPGVIDKFAAAGVNTIIAPESGSLITFTHAAQSKGFSPNYYVWPCSGQDSLGMVRLYNAAQWRKAAGLTCYDSELNADLTNDERARQTQWYKAYQEIEGSGAEPPAPTALVYQSLLPLVAGITHAGRDLTIERWRAGQRAVDTFRYDAIDGVTKDRSNLLVTLSAADGSQIGDAARVFWDATRTTPGNPSPGTYSFLDRRRYRRGASF